ncbi:hypothetical protein ACX0FG_15650, partial [Enterococcus faecium]
TEKTFYKFNMFFMQMLPQGAAAAYLDEEKKKQLTSDTELLSIDTACVPRMLPGHASVNM